MALSLGGERSVASASPSNPFAAIRRWIAKAQAARTRRAALTGLLELEPSRLADLGVSRDDVLAALRHGAGANLGLNAARARNRRA
jgi:uncharacterized protein YjiS (DUF1127 family)